jgi:hypothetical protein
MRRSPQQYSHYTSVEKVVVPESGVFSCTVHHTLLSFDVACTAAVAAVVAAAAAMNPDLAGEVWPGVAGVFQVSCILASGLLFFVSRTPADGSGGGYEVF